MFEAIHGTAPDIAGKNIANPSGMINAANMMLVHMGKSDVATHIQNAWLKTIEDGIHTADIYSVRILFLPLMTLSDGCFLYLQSTNLFSRKVGTSEFTKEVIARLGAKPEKLKVTQFGASKIGITMSERPRQKKEQVGLDIFLEWDKSNRDPEVLGAALKAFAAKQPTPLKLKVITNRGVRVYPEGIPETFCTDHWRCRFVKPDLSPVTHQMMLQLQQDLINAGFDIIKTEGLYNFNGKRAYSLAQGE
jgi:isocitrate dehydrogenase